MIPADALQRLEQGLQDLQKQQYGAAIAKFKEFCQRFPHQQNPQFLQAKMGLIRAYRAQGETEEAIAHCQDLVNHPHPEVDRWAKGLLSVLTPDFSEEDEEALPPSTLPKASRSGKAPAKLFRPRQADSYGLVLVLGFLLPWLGGAVPLGLLCALFLPWPLGFAWGGVVSLLVMFLFGAAAIPVQDQLQLRFYQTQPINLGDIQKYSPEGGELLLRFCRQAKIPLPRLGLINDRRAQVFAYGGRGDQAFLGLSKGVFRYLDPEEIAVLLAQQLGHISRGDGALMTWVSGSGQFFYWLYLLLQTRRREFPLWGRLLTWAPARLCLFLFRYNQFLNRYLSRSRTYYADHFASQWTGNPNGLIRALVKCSKALVKQERQAETPSLFLEGLRNFGVYDPKSAQSCERGSHFSSQIISRLLVWDWFNPWARWTEWRSSHPLLGERVQVLGRYAEQLDLSSQYALEEIRRETKTQKLNPYPAFIQDWCLALLPWLAALSAALAARFWPDCPWRLGSGFAWGFGLGFFVQTLILQQLPRQLTAPDVLSLLTSEQTSPLWGSQVQWTGKLRLLDVQGWGTPKLYFHDRSGVIPVVYPYWRRWLPPFNPLDQQIEVFLNDACGVTGYVNRGITPTLTLKFLSLPTAPVVPVFLHPYLRQFLLAFGAVLGGLALWSLGG